MQQKRYIGHRTMQNYLPHTTLDTTVQKGAENYRQRRTRAVLGVHGATQMSEKVNDVEPIAVHCIPTQACGTVARTIPYLFLGAKNCGRNSF